MCYASYNFLDDHVSTPLVVGDNDGLRTDDIVDETTRSSRSYLSYRQASFRMDLLIVCLQRSTVDHGTRCRLVCSCELADNKKNLSFEATTSRSPLRGCETTFVLKCFKNHLGHIANKNGLLSPAIEPSRDRRLRPAFITDFFRFRHRPFPQYEPCRHSVIRSTSSCIILCSLLPNC